jgi:hypothetical protein
MPLCVGQLRMYAHDQHFLVVAPVEDADPPALGQSLRTAPREVVAPFELAPPAASVHAKARGVHTGKHPADGAVFAGRVHRLEDREQG